MDIKDQLKDILIDQVAESLGPAFYSGSQAARGNPIDWQSFALLMESIS
jgi:hypothetical protein